MSNDCLVLRASGHGPGSSAARGPTGAVRAPRPRVRACGFTVVEALAAGMILAGAAGVLGQIVAGTMESLRLARDTQRAAQLIDQTLTKIDLMGPARLLEQGPTEGSFFGPDAKFRWQAEIAARLQGHLYEVTVQVNWDTERGRRSAQATTLLNDPPLSRSAAVRWNDL